jgi:hypothetical protein
MINIDENKAKILELLKFENPDLLDYLCESDFFTAPCSRSHHLAERGGLAEHSLNVFRRLLDMAPDHAWLTLRTITVCGLLHDLCKANFYAIEIANRKINPKDPYSKWESYERYCYADQLPLGHGEKSAFLLLRLGVPISNEELAAIRWHMGPWAVQGDAGAQKALSAAQKMWPLVTLLHVADMLATHIMERENGE